MNRSFYAIALMVLATPAAADREEPLWEAGLGVAGLVFPDYRGSSQSHSYAFPAPYFVYRGDFFKADRHGVRGTFFKDDRVDLNLSIGASLPVDSSETEARAGMPDLHGSIEVGPSLEVTLWRSANRSMKFDLRMPLRAAFTVESHSQYIGVQFFPHANVDVADALGYTGWNLGLVAGPVFTDRRYNKYFYEVAPEFATANRPAFTAPAGGYAGMQFLVALSKRFPSYWIGGFARYDTLKGASFEDSPLVTSKRYAAAGIGISWIIGASKERVPVDEYGIAK